MASVQPTSGMPGPNQGGVMALPAGITKEQIQSTYLKYQQMKQNNVRDDDPEFIKVRNILQAVTQQQMIQKQKRAYLEKQQMLQQQQQQNGTAHTANGSQVASTPTANGSIGSTAGSGSNDNGMNHAAQQAGTDGKPAQGTPGPMINGFTQQQIHLLRQQVAIFKRLSKASSLTPDMQQSLFPSKQATKSPTPAEAVAAAGQALEKPTEISDKEEDNAHKGFKTFTDPYTLFDKTISYSNHTLREKRPILPSIMPVGVDVDKLREEREIILYNRIQARKEELESLPANVGIWDTSKSDAPSDEHAKNLKLKALIEYKKLCLLPKQTQLRREIGKQMLYADNLAMTANRAMYRRVKKQSLREARITEKLEKQQRDARESKEKKEQNDQLKAVILRGEEISKAAINQKHRLQRLGRTMLQTHQNIEKEEQKRVERTAKQRLQALKANDEETYLKLLGQAKDTRISHLLKQTDGFLNQLAASVKEQQRSAAHRYGQDIASEPSDDEDDALDDDDPQKKSNRIDYYEVAHRIKEEVTEQSSNLVGGKLKEYQLKGLQWMISLYNNNLNGILADEMGLGKTIQTISLITYLIEKKQQPGPYLVIVPLSTLTNWNNEFEKWAPSVKRIVYKGPPAQRRVQQQQIRWGNFQVLLTTYEFIIKDRPILSKIKWLHMIVDEGHRMKNSNSKLSSTITQYYTTRYRLILTGTPLQNNLPELWALLNFVLPTIFKSVKSFDEWFNTPFANTGGQDKMELSEEEQLLVIRRLHKVLRPFLLRRLKKDVEKDLPDKQERVIKCTFSALQAKLYKQLVNHNRLMVSDGKGGKTGMRGLSNMLMQLRKLCNHPFVFEEVEDQVNPGRGTNDLIWRTAGKFELLDRILPKFRETGHRVLMFFQMTQIMNIMEDFLRLRGLQYLRLDGSTKSDDRSELLRLFNAPDSPYFCFLLSTRAGGLGLNLQSADTVIIYDSDWNPHQDLQAQDRAHRIGQKNEVRILRLISSNSVEEKILERANFKLDMDGKVIQAGKFDNKSTNEERDAMLRIMLESAEAADNLEQAEMDDEDLNVIMMRSESELQVFRDIDDRRAKDDMYGPDKKFPRLLSENELPEIYVSDDNPVVEEIEESTGRGARERRQVKYDDGLTEEQWLEAVDNDEDTIEAAIARKEAAKARRATNKARRLGDDAESPAPSRESSEEPQPPKKRGRKPKVVEKRKADEASLDGDVTPAPRKRGRQAKVTETLSAEDRQALQKILNNVYEALNDLEEQPPPGEDLQPRGIIDPFIVLPDRTDYPDYYKIIPQPICMDQIKKKINKKEYQHTRQFRADMALLCNNCRTYNEDGSILYLDANLIEDTCVKKLMEETADYPQFQDFEDGGHSARPSTGPVSSVGTPLASGGRK
ncbi:SNF2 family N-terminal domain-containing protein [Phyllosticta citricarpa]|uniref:SNF2 family N-terminal domain-containing protein n=2 Tax=Phyllosticta TaxID=121621 RepID=A0ABR1NCT9_9PEZI